MIVIELVRPSARDRVWVSDVEPVSAGPRRQGFQALVGDRVWNALLDARVERCYRPKSFLLRQGEPGGYLLALVRGRVQVLARSEDGSQLMVALRGPGDLVGEMALRPGAERTGTVQALDEVMACPVLADEFDRFLAVHCGHRAFSDYLIAKLSETVPYQVQTAHLTPLQRIARLLLEVVALAGSDSPNPLRVPLSQEAIAVALGLSRSTVAQRVSELRRTGALTAGPRLVVADVSSLADAAGLETNTPST